MHIFFNGHKNLTEKAEQKCFKIAETLMQNFPISSGTTTMKSFSTPHLENLMVCAILLIKQDINIAYKFYRTEYYVHHIELNTFKRVFND